MKKSTKIIRLSVTLLLLIAMLLTPMSPVFAVVIENGDADLTAADIVSEDASKREKFSRHYLTGDGTYFAVSYAEQVNYQDEDGNWIAVDNSLSTNVLTGEKTTKNDKFKVKFANKANKDDLVTIKTKEYEVSFGITVSEDGESYLELNKVKGTENPGNTSAEPKTTQEATSLGKAVSGITYFDAFSDYLDVRYSVAHEKVKEDLILEKKSGFNSYKVTYNIKEKDALATLNDDGSITFTSPDGALLFNVGVPVMYDSEGKTSADIAVSMAQGKKTVEVTYTPSAEWLNAEERAYPVTIDPILSSPKATSNIIDFSCYFCNEFDSINFGATTLYMGMDYHTYIRFSSVATMPSGASFTGSYLMFHGTDMSDSSITDPCSVQISNISQYWDAGSFSYEDGYYNEYNPIATSSTITVNNVTFDTDNGMDIIELSLDGFYSTVSGYSNFYSSSYGFIVNMSYEYDFRACSSEYSTLYCRPCVVLSYADPIANGEYYISNASDSLDESVLTNYDSASFLSHFDESDNQLWEITNLGNGYYKIINSATNAALTSSGLEDYSYSDYYGANNQQWRIILTDSDNYMLQSKSQESSNLMLGEASGDLTSTTAFDEWFIFTEGVPSSIGIEYQIDGYSCWAASARMFAKHYYPSIQSTQQNVIDYIKGDNENLGGTMNETANAINFLNNNITCSAYGAMILSESELISALDNGHVIFARIEPTIAGTNSLTVVMGHAVVISGYVCNGNNIYFIILDPENGVYLNSYLELKYGFNSAVTTVRWFGTIIRNGSGISVTESAYL